MIGVFTFLVKPTNQDYPYFNPVQDINPKTNPNIFG